MLTVLGAAGFIGSRLVDRLVAEGHEVRAVDLHPPTLAHRVASWESAAERLVLDLRTYHGAQTAVNGSEQVFHLAADVGGVGYLATHDYRPFYNNMRMSMNVLESCHFARVDRMFYTSSSCVYPVEDQIRAYPVCLREDLHIETGQPDLMYGREKLMTLRLCERAPFDARVGIMNTIFGPGLKLEGDRMKYPAAITVRALQAIDDGGPLDIWGDGTQVRGYLHVDDAVEKILRIMRDPYDGPVNVTSEGVASCNEVAEMVLSILGHPQIPLRHVEGPTGPAFRWVSNEKWERTYGEDPSRSMREAFEDFVAWVQSQS
jgi:GDP-D-mannose 3',5'-epimerase